MSETRDRACADVAAAELLTLRPSGTIAVVDVITDQVADTLSSVGASAVRWHTRAWENRPAMAEPPEGAWDGTLIRLPRERARLALLLELVAARLAPGATLWVVGGNDEGIKSTGKRLAPWFDNVETLTARKHCRLLGARRTEAPARGTLAAHELRQPIALPGVPDPVDFVTLPGLFAKGGLDSATALLLQQVPGLSLTGPCLDFACGLGPIAVGVDRLHPGLSWTLSDVDAWAVHCAHQNLPDARVVMGHGWAPVPQDATYGAIFSNPPLHRGVTADRSTLDNLIAKAPARLNKGGQLVLVSQVTAGAGRRLRQHFGKVRILGEDRRFQVWLAQV